MRVLVAATLLAVVLSACSRDAPPHEVDFNKLPPNFSLSAFGGTLIGYNAGEWGGKLSFRSSNGGAQDVISENVQSIVAIGEDVIVFTGLSHLGVNRGHIYLLVPDKERSFSVQSLFVLEGAPDAIEFKPSGIEFRVFSGRYDLRSDPGREIYACKLLTSDYRLVTRARCNEPQP